MTFRNIVWWVGLLGILIGGFFLLMHLIQTSQHLDRWCAFFGAIFVGWAFDVLHRFKQLRDKHIAIKNYKKVMECVKNDRIGTD